MDSVETNQGLCWLAEVSLLCYGQDTLLSQCLASLRSINKKVPVNFKLSLIKNLNVGRLPTPYDGKETHLWNRNDYLMDSCNGNRSGEILTFCSRRVSYLKTESKHFGIILERNKSHTKQT